MAKIITNFGNERFEGTSEEFRQVLKTKLAAPDQMKTFKVILEDQWTNRLVFTTIEDCVDLEDCVNHIHSEFPSHTIDQITEVNLLCFMYLC